MRIDYYTPTNMLTAQTWYGYLTGASGSTITITNGYRTGIYYGSFSYAGDAVYGRVTGYRQFAGSSVEYVISDVDFDANTVYRYVQSNQLQNVLGLAANQNTLISGSSSRDVLIGVGRYNVFFGNGGNDTIQGNTENGTFNVSQYSGSKSQYTVTKSLGTITVADKISGRDGGDTLLSMNYLQFTDQAITIAPLNSSYQQAALLYQGALGRTPDPSGLSYWVNLIENLPSSTKALGLYGLSDASGNYNSNLSIAAGFTQSVEFIQKYGSLTNEQFVTQLYANVLDRRPDTAGFSDWVNQLTSGVTREHVLVGFAESTEALSNASAGFVGISGTHDPWLIIV